MTLMILMMMLIRMMITCPPSTVATGKGTESADLPPDVRMFNENIRGVVKNGLFTVRLTVRGGGGGTSSLGSDREQM